SYNQNDCYLNEIDALSCNNRPISSTLRSKSTYNTYESQTEDDLFGNQEYNDGSSCDSYYHHQRSTSTMSNTDNLMYHRDACSGDSSSNRYDICTAPDYSVYDNRSDDFGNYGSFWDGNNDRPYTALGDSSNNKILPQIPSVQHSHSMWDDNSGNTTTMVSTTTSMSPYGNHTNLDYKMATPVSSTSQKLPHSTISNNIYHNNGGVTESQLKNCETDYNSIYYMYGSRLHTAMPTTEDYGVFGLNSMDNMSTYSDTTAPCSTNASVTQQKLQDLQKCRYSIIMAMTTASVIASALNSSDNKISHNKSSISAPVTTETKISTEIPCSSSVVSITSTTSCYATSAATSSLSSSSISPLDTVMPATVIKTTTASQTTTPTATTNIERITNENLPHDYNHYLKDYRLDFLTTTLKPSETVTMAMATASSNTTTTDTSITTISMISPTAATSDIFSLPTLNKLSKTFSYTTTIMDNSSDYTSNNNETKDTVSLFSSNCLFTTTTSTADVDSKLTTTTAADTSNITSKNYDYLSAIKGEATTSTPSSYANYLKDYTTTVTASSSNTSLVLETKSQELPAYITSFLNSSKTIEYSSLNYLNFYKITDGTVIDKDMDMNITTETGKKTKPDTEIDILNAINTINNNTITTLYDPTATTSVKTTTFGESESAVAAALKTDNDVTKLTMAFTSLPSFTSKASTTFDSNSMLSLNQSSPTKKKLTANTALTTAVDFDDNFYSSFSVNLNSFFFGDNITTAISTAPITNTAVTVTSYDKTESMSASEATSSAAPSMLPAAASSPIDTFTTTLVSFNSNITSKPTLNVSSSNTAMMSSSVNDIPSTDIGADDLYCSSTKGAATNKASNTTTNCLPQRTTPGVKSATSMLGGLSQSLKGGLDGVLAPSGSGGPSETTQQQKRVFSFGLASKLVPQVGGLLGTGTKSSTPSTYTGTRSVLPRGYCLD
ncbi:hypothetical protein DOY81_011611, partial [Sarcophaga bullata]